LQSHLTKGANTIGVAPVIGGTYFATAYTVVHNLLLIFEIAQIGADYRTEFFVTTSPSLRRSDCRSAEEEHNGSDFAESDPHNFFCLLGLTPALAIDEFGSGADYTFSRNFTSLHGGFSNVTLIFNLRVVFRINRGC
jgi:hypothetical protein